MAPWSYEIAVRGGTLKQNRWHLVQYPGNGVQSLDLIPQPEESTCTPGNVKFVEGSLQSDVSDDDAPQQLEVRSQLEASVQVEQEVHDRSVEY